MKMFMLKDIGNAVCMSLCFGFIILNINMIISYSRNNTHLFLIAESLRLVHFKFFDKMTLISLNA